MTFANVSMKGFSKLNIIWLKETELGYGGWFQHYNCLKHSIKAHLAAQIEQGETILLPRPPSYDPGFIQFNHRNSHSSKYFVEV